MSSSDPDRFAGERAHRFRHGGPLVCGEVVEGFLSQEPQAECTAAEPEGLRLGSQLLQDFDAALKADRAIRYG
ncbi:hypothetical protein [Streptomyces aureus]|uniref:Uncharacterized protein n=1 Tax=Streptomyces aureus TaxID=193461 RepID=A0ABV4SX18_9ACTN